jgi:hypothetical protein
LAGTVDGTLAIRRWLCNLTASAHALASPSAAHALHVLEIILKATQSASEGCAIGLETGF